MCEIKFEFEFDKNIDSDYYIKFKEGLRLINYINQQPELYELLSEGHNLKLYEILAYCYNNNISDETFYTYASDSYDNFILDLKEQYNIDFYDYIDYIGHTSTFYYWVGNNTAYGGYLENTICESIYDGYTTDILDSIKSAIKINELIEYYKSIDTFKDFLDSKDYIDEL